MIRINSLEELKPYVSYIESKYIDGLHSHIVISFEKEGKLDKAIIDCKCELREPNKTIQKTLGVDKQVMADKYAQYVLVEIHAKELILNDKSSCSKIVCEGLYIKKGKKLRVDYVEAKNFVGGGSIKAYGVFCDVLYIEKLNCERIECKTISVKKDYKDKIVIADKLQSIKCQKLM
jgi:hypothetical protein